MPKWTRCGGAGGAGGAGGTFRSWSGFERGGWGPVHSATVFSDKTFQATVPSGRDIADFPLITASVDFGQDRGTFGRQPKRRCRDLTQRGTEVRNAGQAAGYRFVQAHCQPQGIDAWWHSGDVDGDCARSGEPDRSFHGGGVVEEDEIVVVSAFPFEVTWKTMRSTVPGLMPVTSTVNCDEPRGAFWPRTSDVIVSPEMFLA